MINSQPESRHGDAAGRLLGQRLRALRIAQGLSQTELAGDTLSASMISLLEAGRREPTERTLELLAKRLHSSTEYLRHGTTTGSADKLRLEVLEAEMALHSGRAEDALDRFTKLAGLLGGSVVSRGIDEHLVRGVRLGKAMALENTDRVAEAVAELEDLRSATPITSEDWLLDVDVVLSRCYRKVGRHTDCFELTTTTLRLVESLGLQGMANHSELAVNLIYELHEHRRMVDALAEATRHLDGLLIPATLEPARAYQDASTNAAENGHTAEALSMAERALAAYRGVTDARSTANLRVIAANVVLHNDPTHTALATKALQQTYDLLLPLGALTELSTCETALARAAVARNDAEEAMSWAEVAIAHTEERQHRPERAWALMVRCRCHHTAGRSDLARVDADATRQVLATLAPGRHTAGGWRELGNVLRDLGDVQAAMDAYEQALDAMDVRRVSRIDTS